MAYYGKNELGKKTYRGKKYPCLWDPDDIRHGYAFVQQGWKELSSNYYGALKNLSPLEVSCASREVRFVKSKADFDEVSESRIFKQLLECIEIKEEALESNKIHDKPIDEKFAVVRANKDLAKALDYSNRTPAQREAIRDFF